MITKLEYLNQTEHASKSLFSAIGEYKDLIRLSVPPGTTFRHNGEEGGFEKQFEAWRNQSHVKEQHEVADYAREEFRGQLFSMHVISGSILQIACKAIELFSKHETSQDQYSELFTDCSKGQIKNASKFCIGREIQGIPIGLIIFAGRNQYNHIEAGSSLNQLNKNIFNRIADKDDYINPSFDLDNEGITSYSSNIRSHIGWSNYENYYDDMFLLMK